MAVKVVCMMYDDRRTVRFRFQGVVRHGTVV